MVLKHVTDRINAVKQIQRKYVVIFLHYFLYIFHKYILADIKESCYHLPDNLNKY